MVGARFDIFFAGELSANANPTEVRRRLQRRFRLSEDGVARLFSGHMVTVKRDVDAATASRYREIFQDAGALIEIHPVEATSETPPADAAEPLASSVSPEPEEKIPTQSKEPGTERHRAVGEPLERPPSRDFAMIDTSHLSLVPGQDWTLEDCKPELPPIKLPDISHLELVGLPPSDGEERLE